MNHSSRWRSLRNRLALIAIGVLIGLAGRWLIPPASSDRQPNLFVPLPAAAAPAR